VDLPTYTNIWRIEKRLYKLYDFKLPMPLPINWIAVFAGITIPYIVLLIAIGLPFNHTLVWLYVLPPGLLTWLTTRPVIENKRLPELVESQMRYLGEPRTWVRLTPLSEKDKMVLTARVWRSRQTTKRSAPAARPAVARALTAGEPVRPAQPMRPGAVLKPTSVFRPERAAAGLAYAQEQAVQGRSALGQAARGQAPHGQAGRPPQDPAAPQRLRVRERSRAQERRPRVPVSGRSGAWPLPGLPPVRPVTPVIPDPVAGRADRPTSIFGPAFLPGDPPRRHQQNEGSVHAMPDVSPPSAASAAPAAPAPAAPAPAAPAPAAPAPAAPAPAAPAAARSRAAGPSAPQLELSHDGPRRPAGTGTTQAPGRPSAPTVWPARPGPAPRAAQPGPVKPVQPEPPVKPVRAARQTRSGGTAGRADPSGSTGPTGTIRAEVADRSTVSSRPAATERAAVSSRAGRAGRTADTGLSAGWLGARLAGSRPPAAGRGTWGD
jgi:hypothetical protein